MALDIRFLRHPQIGLYLELFTYHHPQGDQNIHRRKANDLGGIRHVAVEVSDAVAAYEFIRSQQQSYGERGLGIEILGQDHTPEEITPYRDLCGCPHKSPYGEAGVMPRSRRDRWANAASCWEASA